MPNDQKTITTLITEADDKAAQVLGASVAGIDTSSSDHATRMKSKACSEEYNRTKQETAAAVAGLTTGSAATRSPAFTKTPQLEVNDDKDELARLPTDFTISTFAADVASARLLQNCVDYLIEAKMENETNRKLLQDNLAHIDELNRALGSLALNQLMTPINFKFIIQHPAYSSELAPILNALKMGGILNPQNYDLLSCNLKYARAIRLGIQLDLNPLKRGFPLTQSEFIDCIQQAKKSDEKDIATARIKTAKGTAVAEEIVDDVSQAFRSCSP